MQRTGLGGVGLSLPGGSICCGMSLSQQKELNLNAARCLRVPICPLHGESRVQTLILHLPRGDKALRRYAPSLPTQAGHDHGLA